MNKRQRKKNTRYIRFAPAVFTMIDLFAYGVLTKNWTAPIIKEEFICMNCDAEHDGVDWHPNHTADAWCRYYEDA